MRESDVVTKIKTELQKRLPTAVIFKLQDYMTTGIPDLVINYGGRTVWVEIKLLKMHETPSSLRKHFDKVQLTTCILLERQASCYYFVVGQNSKGFASSGSLFSPRILSGCLAKKDLTFGNFLNAAGYADYFAQVIARLGNLVEGEIT